MKKVIGCLFILLFTIACSESSIEKEEQDILPQFTETGANTAGVVIDEYVLIPKDGFSTGYLQYGSLIRGLEVELGSDFITSQGNATFSLTIKNLDRKNGYLFIMELGLLNQTGNIATIGGPIRPRIYVGKQINGPVKQQFYSRPNSCNIMITKLDFNSRIISGTFAGEVFDENNNKIELKDGRFDVKMQ